MHRYGLYETCTASSKTFRITYARKEGECKDANGAYVPACPPPPPGHPAPPCPEESIMEMPKETGLRLINARVPNFAFVIFNRNTSANYQFKIRAFSIWDDPNSNQAKADLDANIVICGTEKVTLTQNAKPIRMVFERNMRRYKFRGRCTTCQTQGTTADKVG